MSEKESILLSDVSITGDVVEKEKLSVDSKISGNIKADEINTFDELLYLDDITLWNLLSCIDQKPLKDAKKNKLIKRIQLFKSNR